MTSICHFSRYVSLTLVESLSKDSILKAMDNHSLRYGRAQLVESDMGTNYVAARQALEEDNDDIDPKIIKENVTDARSKGTELP